MNFKEEIQYNATEYDRNYKLNEMAAQHIDNDVIAKIKAGDFEAAAKKYIENHEVYSPKSEPKSKADVTVNKLRRGDISTSLKADADKVKEVTRSEWDNFKKAYAKVMGTEGETTRAYKKSKGTVDGATGEIKTSSHKDTTKQLHSKIQDVYNEYKELLAKTDDPGKKEEIKSHMSALQILSDATTSAEKGKPPLAPTTEAEVNKLKARLRKVGKTYASKGKSSISKEQRAARQDAIAKRAHERLLNRMTGVKDLEDIDDLVQDFRERKALMANRGSQDVAGLDKYRNKNENFKLRETILAESLNYEGVDFWHNYAGSTLIKMFNEDVRKLGALDAANSYVEIFGEETIPLFKFLASHTEELNEVSQIKEPLLFEEVGYRNLSNYLREVATFSQIEGGGSLASKAAGVGAQKLKGKSGGLLKDFLQNAWGKIKEFGGPIINKLGLFLGKGVKWAKEFAEKGLEFIWSNPVTKIAVPAVALAGTIAGGIAIVNKIRKKAGKSKLSAEQKKEFRNVAQNREAELEKLGVNV